jgi:hypothetical protein
MFKPIHAFRAFHALCREYDQQDGVQSYINYNRNAFAYDQEIQLYLDRRQADLDSARKSSDSRFNAVFA